VRNDGDTDIPDRAGPAPVHDLREVVMGLHWTPPEHGAAVEPADLDALCVLFDSNQHVLEVVCPAHPRNANGSTIHTGDSRSGASEWDDERIFVFLEALPESVSFLAFVVVSVTGRAFSEVRGASCHISDHLTEHEWVRVQLTDLGRHTAHCVATMHRGATGWEPPTSDARAINAESMTQLLSWAGSRKGSAV